MSRHLRALFVQIGLDVVAYRLRDGLEDAPRVGVSWDLDTLDRGRREYFSARARLPVVAGRVVTDTDYDTDTNGPRRISLPSLAASGIREVYALELIQETDVAGGGSDVLWRLSDGADEYYWTGAAWAVATDPLLHWSTRPQVENHANTFPLGGRAIGPIAWLRSTDATQNATVYAWRVAYGIRDLGDEDDALARTVLAALRAELEARAVVQVRSTGSAVIAVAQEIKYPDVVGVDAAYDLTDDPGEETPLSGTWNGAARTFTLSAARPAGNVLHLEIAYRPHAAVSVHRDLQEVDQLPAVLLMPSDAPQVWRAQDETIVRDLRSDPPEAFRIPASALADQPLEVRVLAEVAPDLRRLLSALRAWFGGYGARDLVSPLSGRIVQVREVETPRAQGISLGRGVEEARGVWAVRYSVAGADAGDLIPLIRDEGVIVALEGS